MAGRASSLHPAEQDIDGQLVGEQRTDLMEPSSAHAYP
jgi:hypothetical protein